jgi:tripartite-type tricarboxylate transporter receptor subunit TctC
MLAPHPISHAQRSGNETHRRLVNRHSAISHRTTVEEDAMQVKLRTLGLWLSAIVFAPSMVAVAQDKPSGYPARPIRIIISVAPGAGADYIARTTAQILADRWGQNAVVDSRPGGGGVIAVETLARANPDGHTMLQYGDGMVLMGAQKRVPFDVFKAFEPVVSSSTQPYILIAHPSLAAQSAKELIALSAAKPVTYGGGGGMFATVHVGIERLAAETGMRVKYIAYKGSAPAILAVMAGEIQMACTSAMAATSAIRTGKVRGLANLGERRIPALPDLPTIAEQGITGYKLTNRYNLWVPAGTPQPVIMAINQVVSEGMHAPQMVQRLAVEGSEPAERLMPAELKKTIAREYAEVERTLKTIAQTR